MSKKIEIISGDRFNKLTIIKEVESNIQPSGQRKRNFLCKCDCGNELKIVLSHLRSNHTLSCGCHKYNLIKKNIPQKKHGHTKNDGYRSRTYNSWKCMRDRCNYPSSMNYEYYGGRGITICDRWENSFINFLEDMGF